MRRIDEIIVHCTATRAAWWEKKRTDEKVAEIKRWHTDPKPKGRGWSDIGYHFLIDRDGAVAKGRPVERIGAHVAGHNTGTIGIALFGGHGSSETDHFSDNFTPSQDRALRELINSLSRKYDIRKISGHNEYAAKACPGFNVPKWQAMSHRNPPDVEPVETPTAQPPQNPLAALLRALLALFQRMQA